ncbi:MAG: tetratricopeptide repeat protein [Bryobacteraceae bacterium]
MKFPVLFLAAALCLRSQSSDLTQQLLAIQEAIQAGDLATASRLVDSSLEQHPHEGGLFNLRGIVHARRNQLVEARKDFAEAVRLAPGLTPAWQNLARACQLEAEDASSVSCAIDSWQHVLRSKPGDVEAHRSLALLYESRGKFAESLRELDKLPVEEASRSGNLALRCIDLARLGQVAEAKSAASHLAARPDFSESDLDGLQDPWNSPKSAAVVVTLVEALDARHAASLVSLQHLAVAYEQLQRPSEARKTLERVAMLDPNNTAHLLELARLADASKDYEGALGYLAHARDLAPDNPRMHFLFAMVAVEMNLPVEARRSLERALALDPENPGYNYAMGSVILSTRDAASAAGYFEKFVKANPADSRGHYALGIAYFASGDYSKAKEEMRRVASGSKVGAGAEYFLGRIARLEGELEDAARHLHKSIELKTSFSEPHTELARVCMLQGNLDEARAELDRALWLDPRSFQGNNELLVLYKRTRDPRAEKQAEFLKKLDEDRSKRAELMLRTIEVRP